MQDRKMTTSQRKARQGKLNEELKVHSEFSQNSNLSAFLVNYLHHSLHSLDSDNKTSQ